MVAVARDHLGNMIRMPMPGIGTTALDVKYDAWNRMETVSVGSVRVGRCDYDAAGWRIIMPRGIVYSSWPARDITGGIP